VPSTSAAVFPNDVFVSYGHLDNLQLGDGRDGWVTAFHNDLAVLLSQEIGRPARIWRDERLEGNTDFGPELLAALRESAVILPIVSRRYVESEWCIRELSRFVEYAGAALTDLRTHRARVCPVLVNPLPHHDLPPLLQRFLGYRFFGSPGGATRATRLDRRFGEAHQQAYYQVLQDLAEDVGQLIRSMAATDNGAGHRVAGGTIFLASGSEDTREIREGIARDLRGRGLAVVPQGLPPGGGKDLDDLMLSQMAQSDLSIHLVGAEMATGRSPEFARIELQARRAHELSGRGLPSLFWIDPELPLSSAVAGSDHRYLAWLRDEVAKAQSIDLVQSHVEELKSVAMDMLGQGGGRGGPVDATPIYVAEATSDLAAERSRLTAGLAQKGHTVLGAAAAPYTPAYLDSVRPEMEKARISIHVLGGRRAVVPEGLDRTTDQLQADLAAQRLEGGGLDQILWLVPSSELDPRQRSVRESLAAASVQHDHVHLVDGGDLATVEALVERLLRPTPSDPATDATAGTVGEGEGSVYLLYDEADWEAAEELRDRLWDLGVDVLSPLSDGSPEEVREQHEENLREATAVLVFHATAGERWLTVQVRNLRRAPALRDGRPLLVGVWMAPPDDRHKERFRVRGVTVLQSSEDADVEQFLNGPGAE